MFVCCDQAGLQDRAFAHYLAEFDDGAYARAFTGGLDTHWASVLALGLVPTGTERDKASKFHTALREGAKSFRYGFLFGAQAKRAGIIIRDTIRAAMSVNSDSDLLQRFFGGKIAPDETALARVGRDALERFEAATPGLRAAARELAPTGRSVRLAPRSRRSPHSGARALHGAQLRGHQRGGGDLQMVARTRLRRACMRASATAGTVTS